jgi:hypothetical protein
MPSTLAVSQLLPKFDRAQSFPNRLAEQDTLSRTAKGAGGAVDVGADIFLLLLKLVLFSKMGSSGLWSGGDLHAFDPLPGLPESTEKFHF